MKYLGIYTTLKQFILNTGYHFHRFLSRSDDWVESQNYENLQIWIAIILITSMLFVIFLTWLISKLEKSTNERKKDLEEWDNSYAHPKE